MKMKELLNLPMKVITPAGELGTNTVLNPWEEGVVLPG